MSGRTLILGLGNSVLSDDAVGIHTVRFLHDEAEAAGIDTCEAEVAGFALLDLLAGYETVVVVDAVRVPDIALGEIVVMDATTDIPSLHLVAAHQIDLPSALALGAELGVDLPKVVRVVGVQIENDREFGERCGPLVEAAIPAAARMALDLALGR